VSKKKVTVVSVLSTKAFPTIGLALQLKMPTTAAASIPSRKVGEECWNSSLDDRLKAVVASIQLEAAVTAMSEAARLWEILPIASWV
jgi:hypothetical protein